MSARLSWTIFARPGTAANVGSPLPAVKRRPVPSTTSSSTTLSAVRPYATACGPHALLPIMPPSVARFCVEGSGPNRRPCGAAAFWSVDMTTPGSIRAVRASGSSDRTRLTCREKSITTPGPIELPATEVPAPRAVSGTPSSRVTSRVATTSSVEIGKTTISGTTR